LLATGLEAKRLGLLHELVPRATTIAALVNANYPPAETQLRDLQKAAPSLGVQLFIVRAGAESDFNTAFSTVAQQRAGALQVCSSPLFNARRQHLVLLAARHAILAIYEWRDFAEAGGLMSYGSKLSDSYRQAALCAGRILKSEKPADLPVVASDQIRIRDQSEHREGPRPRRAADAARPRRRGDRMIRRREFVGSTRRARHRRAHQRGSDEVQEKPRDFRFPGCGPQARLQPAPCGIPRRPVRSPRRHAGKALASFNLQYFLRLFSCAPYRPDLKSQGGGDVSIVGSKTRGSRNAGTTCRASFWNSTAMF
jgi:hypothetical protein